MELQLKRRFTQISHLPPSLLWNRGMPGTQRRTRIEKPSNWLPPAVDQAAFRNWQDPVIIRTWPRPSRSMSQP